MLILMAIFIAVCRYTQRTLRLLISLEIMSIIRIVVLLYYRSLGILQIFICIAVLTAVIGLTT
jgi:hypothetical protein